jgi:formate/nitrite transporter
LLRVRTLSDAYLPAEIAKKIESIGVTKATLPVSKTLVLSGLAGAFIGLGAELFTTTTTDSRLGYCPTLLLGGVAFSLGLILVVVAGAELFTGNNLVVMACVSRKITLTQLLRNWILVYAGNFAGALLTVGFVYMSNQWAGDNFMVGARALLIANNKVNLGFFQAFFLGILCNVLVCLAIWLSAAGRSVIDKAIGIIFPITAFVASGFEHSVANMYFIPLGILLRNQDKVVEAAVKLAGKPVDFGALSWSNFVLANLVPVTLGNIVGGSVLVGVVYWLVYLHSEPPPMTQR